MRFLADEMLKKTCRWLRILGADCEFIEELKDDEIILLAKRKKRPLLTSDVGLFRRMHKRNLPVLLLEENDIAKQLMKISNAYPLKLSFPLRTRCPKCNKVLRQVAKKSVKGKVFARVYSAHSSFWKCPKCGKIYWEGTHWKEISGVARRIAHNTSSIELARAL